MNREEAITKLDEAIKEKTFHHSARDDYFKLCNTPKGREEFEKILNMVRQLDRERKERKTARAASRGKEAV